jgi:hypothetical protein
MSQSHQKFAFTFAPVNPFTATARAESERARLEVPADALPGTYTYAMVQNGPAVSSSEVENAQADAIEVTVLWGSNVLSVKHASPERGFAVGEEAGKGRECDCFLPEEKLGATRLPLVLPGGRLVLWPNATGWIDLPGRGKTALARARSEAEPCVEVAGASVVALRRGAFARIELGEFVFQVAAVAAGRPAKRGLGAGFDATMAGFFGTSLLSCAAMIASLAYFVPPIGINEDESAEQARTALIQQYMVASAERNRETEQAQTDESSTGQESGTGERAKGDEGATGSELAKNNNKRWARQGPKDNPAPAIAMTREEAENFGLIGLLRDGAAGDKNSPTAVFGRDEALGNNDFSANGAMWGDDFGESWGKNGLGLLGIGEGGGGRGAGIGLGYIGTYGHGAGTGPGDGFGNSAGRLQGNYAPKPKAGVRMAPVSVSGKLPPEVIQRIVRQNYGRFRLCYEQGLMRNPNLTGRVSVRFVIGRDGAVSNVGSGGSDLPDSGTVSCVLSAFYGLSFPSPDGGIVTVTYPILFSPG